MKTNVGDIFELKNGTTLKFTKTLDDNHVHLFVGPVTDFPQYASCGKLVAEVTEVTSPGHEDDMCESCEKRYYELTGGRPN